MANIVFRDHNVTVFQSALYQMNSTVVHTEDVIIVFDPGILPGEVRAIQHLVAEKRGSKPLYLIFTHSDFDHIAGFGAFRPSKVFMTEAMSNNPKKEQIIEEILNFDEQYYLVRDYPIVYPSAGFLVFKDGGQFRIGQTKISIYLTPGHTADSMMIVVWQLGLLIAGDYLSDVEFPIITESSVSYEQSLLKLNTIHDKNWFTRIVPGHGNLTDNMKGWIHRQQESLAYIYALRESISTGIPFDEDSLWSRYPMQRALQQYHLDNLALMRREYENGLWEWTPDRNEESR